MKAQHKEITEPPAEHKPEIRIFVLILAVISLLMVHIVFSGIVQPLKTTPRLWTLYSEESAELTQISSGEEMSVAASQDHLDENIKLEQRFVELAQREAQMRQEIQNLQAENKKLAENLDTCTDELTLVNAAATVAIFKQFGDPATRDEYFLKKPSTVELIDRLVDAPNLCCQHLQECQKVRIEAGEADSVVEPEFAVQAYKDCRDVADTLKWNLVLYEAKEKFGSARSGPWSQEAWAYVMSKMSENELEDFDSLLLSHQPSPFNYPEAPSRLPFDDFDEQYDYSFKDSFYDEDYKYSYDYSYDNSYGYRYNDERYKYSYEDDGVAR